MRFVDRRLLALFLLGLVVACSTPKPPTAPKPPVDPAPVLPSAPAAPTTPDARGPLLPPPQPVKTQAELQRQAALRLLAANPERAYSHKAPEVLLAVPVFRVDLNWDGSIRRIEVMREPGQARETIQLAREAIERAAPFGNVQALPRPWFFTESFLFDDARRFKPRSLE